MTYEFERDQLEQQLENTDDFGEQMEIRGQLTDLKIKYNLIKPNDCNEEECISCSS